VRAGKDPRTYDWSRLANMTRGFCEYLIEYNADGSFSGILLESWEANEDATQYTLNVRPGVTFNNGDASRPRTWRANFTSAGATSVEGNSMATRMGGSSIPTPAVPRRCDRGVGRHDRAAEPARPDITLIVPAMADYPSADPAHRDTSARNPLEHGVGTGAYRIVSHEVGVGAVLEKNPDHDYWGEAYLDRGRVHRPRQDPAAWFAGAEAGEFDMTYETVGEFIDLFGDRLEQLGGRDGRHHRAPSNQNNPPYDNVVRRAMLMAVDRRSVVELGYERPGHDGGKPPCLPDPPRIRRAAEYEVDKDAAYALLRKRAPTTCSRSSRSTAATAVQHD
jgi:peptide/nickel transport system substrate-binding protein